MEGGKLELPELVAQLEMVGFEPCIDNAIAFAAANQVLLLRHTSSGVDIDLSIAWLPFETEAIAAAESLNLAGAQVRVARAEDLVERHRAEAAVRVGRVGKLDACSHCLAAGERLGKRHDGRLVMTFSRNPHSGTGQVRRGDGIAPLKIGYGQVGVPMKRLSSR